MPAWIHAREQRLEPGMEEQYGPKKGKQVAFAVATQQAHKLGKTPKDYGTAAGKREAKAKFDKPLKAYKKTAGDVMTEEMLKEAMWDAFIDELSKIAQLPSTGVKPPTTGQAGTIKGPGMGGATMGKPPAAPAMPIGGYKPGGPPPIAGSLPANRGRTI